MSADNWSMCPKCREKRIRESEQKKLQALEAYGKVPPQEWVSMTASADNAECDAETLREDYEVWTDENGVFRVSYECVCTADDCDFEFSYSYEQKLEVKADAP